MSDTPVLNLKARLSKLRAMSGRELVARVSYRWQLERERRAHRAGTLAPLTRLEAALADPYRGPGWDQRLLLARRREARERFFPGAAEHSRMRELFAGPFQGERQSALAQAQALREGRVAFFGQEFRLEGNIDWQADPGSGQRWPSVYHADVPINRGDIGCGDIKYVWELNRHQFLIDLAKAHFLTRGERDDLRAIERIVQGWLAGNPYATGVNWSCALEPAFRGLSWLWAYHLTVEDLEDDFHLAWLRGFYDHGRFLARHLELYSSPFNHLIGEASVLLALGYAFPEFREAAGWRHTARSVLESRLPDQFYADGGSVEQSTFYHHATLGFYLLAALTARRHREDLSTAVWQAIERGLNFSLLLTQPDGRIPEIGGADDGKPIRMEHLPFWDFRPYLAIGAVLFSRADLKQVAGRFFEDALWLLGPAGFEAFERLSPAVPTRTSVALSASGYYVMRSGWSHDADYVCIDCGEQAAGVRTDSVPNAMHGHADCLSVVVWLKGKRVLIDSGLFGYNCGGEWEDHFRETAAHNTARVDGRDQARHIGKMAWSNSYRAMPEGWNASGGTPWFRGSHDGYARGPEGVVHRRAVWLEAPGRVSICDEISGVGQHVVEVNFQFAPGVLTLAANDQDVHRPGGTRGSATFDGIVRMTWAGEGHWTARTASGGPSPADGWVAPSLGVRQAAPRLTLTTTAQRERIKLVTAFALPGLDASELTETAPADELLAGPANV